MVNATDELSTVVTIALSPERKSTEETERPRRTLRSPLKNSLGDIGVRDCMGTNLSNLPIDVQPCRSIAPPAQRITT